MNRKDAWSEEDDKLLTETVINCVRTGETQTDAFEYVSDKLGRSPAACGFRWNSTLRKLHEDELKKSKIEGRELKKNSKKEHSENVPERLVSPHTTEPYNSVDSLLNGISEVFRSLQKENDELRREIVRLEKKLDDIPKSDDFQDFLKLLAKAKQNGLFDKETPAS